MSSIDSRVYSSEQIEVPTAFPRIIKDFAKEVIRYSNVHPNITFFARDYFQAQVDGTLDSFLAQCERDSYLIRQEALALERAQARERQVLEQQLLVQETSEPAAKKAPTTAPALDPGAVFDSLDKTRDGQLNYLEIRKGVENNKNFAQLLGGEKAKRFWRKADEDSDKLVTRDEFVAYFSEASAPLATETLGDLAGQVFDELDKTGDGQMNYLEIRKGIEGNAAFKELLDGEKARSFWKKADENGDKLVSKEEFLDFFR